MGSLSSAMAGSNTKTIQMIHINDIRTNADNFYEIDDEIEKLANLILKNDANNGKAYYNDLGDGKHYTLVGGEQRYRAITYLYEKGLHDGLYPVKLIEKPKTKDDEILAIIEDNFQRTKSVEDRKTEIKQLSLVYDHYKDLDKLIDKQLNSGNSLTPEAVTILEEKRKIPKGMKKREWIHTKTGLSPRQVQEYLTGIYATVPVSESDSASLKATDQKASTKEAHQNSADSNTDKFKDLQTCMMRKLGTTIRFSKNKFTVSFTNVHDLNRILKEMDMGDVVNDSRYNH